MKIEDVKVGAKVRVVGRFPSTNGVMWISTMDKYVGNVYRVVEIVGDNVRLDVPENVLFIPGILEHIVDCSQMEIMTEKIVIDGVKCRKVISFFGFPNEQELPSEYRYRRPSVCIRNLGIGYHIFKNGKMDYEWDDNKCDHLIINVSDGVVVDVGIFAFTGIRVGSIWPENTFQVLMGEIKKAKKRLDDIREKERLAWSGIEIVEI